jgi:transcription antitermination factor NusG
MMGVTAVAGEFDEASALEWINRRRAQSRPASEPAMSYGVGSAWFCYRTDPGCDQRAALGLELIGYKVWSPQMVKTVKKGRKAVEVERPLFSRHGFVRVDPNRQGFGPVLRCRFVDSVLGVADTPSRVPDAVIDDLRARAGVGAFDFRIKPATGPKVGERVEIGGDGPFRGWVAEVVQELDDDRRVGILMKLFNSYRVVKISLDELREHAESGDR